MATLALTIGLLRFQPPLILAHKVDALLFEVKIEQAIAIMAEQQESAFPKTRDPLPQSDRKHLSSPDLGDVISALKNTNPPQWVTDRLMVQGDEILLRQNGWWQGVDQRSIANGEMISRESQRLTAIETAADKLGLLKD